MQIEKKKKKKKKLGQKTRQVEKKKFIEFV